MASWLDKVWEARPSATGLFGGGVALLSNIASGQKLSQLGTPRTTTASANTFGAGVNSSPAIKGVTYNSPTNTDTQITNTGSGNTGTSSSNLVSNAYQGLENRAMDTVDELGAMIDRDFEVSMQDLANQETGLRETASTSEAKVRNEGEKSKTALGEAKASSMGALADQQTTAETEESSALKQARDLFRQLQQENIAKLSSLGLSSSSVNEALAEKLGVETARRIASVTSTTDEIINNIAKEKTRITKVFDEKMTQLQDSIGLQITEIQNQLLAGIRSINTARDRAAADKANRRQELYTNAQNQIAQIQFEAAQYAQKLRDAASARSQALQDALPLLQEGDTGISGLNPLIQNSMNALAGSGVNLTPQVKLINGVPQVVGFQSSVKKTEEDPYAAFLASQGVSQ